jgi:hypothetical protein
MVIMAVRQKDVRQGCGLRARKHFIQQKGNIFFGCFCFTCERQTSINSFYKTATLCIYVPVSTSILEEDVPIRYVFVPCNVCGPGFNPKTLVTLLEINSVVLTAGKPFGALD